MKSGFVGLGISPADDKERIRCAVTQWLHCDGRAPTVDK